MTRDLVRCAGDYYFVDLTADQHFAVAILGRHRVVIVPEAPQRQRVDPGSLLLAGFIGNRRQRSSKYSLSSAKLAACGTGTMKLRRA